MIDPPNPLCLRDLASPRLASFLPFNDTVRWRHYSGAVDDEWSISVDQWWNYTDMGKLKYSTKYLCHCPLFFHHKSHVEWSRMEPEPPQWNAANNYMRNLYSVRDWLFYNSKTLFFCFFCLGYTTSNGRHDCERLIIIIIIIIIVIYCDWVVTRWQWLFYMYTKYEIGY